MNDRKDGLPVTVRDPRDHRLDNLAAQQTVTAQNGVGIAVGKLVTEAELVALAHSAYVKVPNEHHQIRLARVVRAICKRLGVALPAGDAVGVPPLGEGDAQ